MALTPVDILHTEFKTAFKGYNKGQVDSFVGSAREALEGALNRTVELENRIRTLEEELEHFRSIESTLKDALTLAQKSADEVKTNARRQAETIVREAEQERVRIKVEAEKDIGKQRTELSLLESTRDRFEAEFRAVLSGYLEWLEKHGSEEDATSEVA